VKSVEVITNKINTVIAKEVDSSIAAYIDVKDRILICIDRKAKKLIVYRSDI